MMRLFYDVFLAVMADAKKWIDNILNTSAQVSLAFWEQAMKDTFKWYRANQGRVPRRSINCSLIVTARSWTARNVAQAEADGICKIYKFAPMNVPLSMFYIMVGPSLTPRDLKVEVFGPDHAIVDFRLLPAFDVGDEGGNRSYGYVLAFDNPLQPLSDQEMNEDCAYTVRMSYSQLGGVSGVVGPTRRDHIHHTNNRAENYDSVDIILRKPIEFKVSSVAKWTNGSSNGLAMEIPRHELRDYDHDMKWEYLGWRVLDVAQGRSLRVEFHRE